MTDRCGSIEDANYRKEVEGQAGWFFVGVNTAVSILHVKFAKRMPGSMAWHYGVFWGIKSVFDYVIVRLGGS